MPFLRRLSRFNAVLKANPNDLGALLPRMNTAVGNLRQSACDTVTNFEGQNNPCDTPDRAYQYEDGCRRA
jgi:hypothetical protein